MTTTTFTAGILRANEMRILLHQMELSFSEVKGFMEVVFVVRMNTSRDITNVQLIRHKIIMENRRERAVEREAERAERNRIYAQKLKRVNFVRQATFRKPLTHLPVKMLTF